MVKAGLAGLEGRDALKGGTVTIGKRLELSGEPVILIPGGSVDDVTPEPGTSPTQ
ncbi:MAG: hypothetical protein ABIJ86_04940 [Spirochaetota bacterium]